MLSDSIERKFVECFSVDDYEVLSDTGFVDITSTNKTIPYQVYRITLSDGNSLLCADDHIIFTEHFDEIFAKDSLGKSIVTKDGIRSVVEISDLGYETNMYDLSVECNHRYYSNGILSHNTTTAVCVILHYILFNSHKLVALLANKGDAAREILSRIQLAYENLPKWLQQGVVEWNKGSVELENGCKVLASSTSGSAIRGKSCVSGDTLVRVCGKITRDIKEIPIKDLTTRYKLYDGNQYRDFDGILVQNKETYTVTTDLGISIRATHDHRFMMQDGAWKALESLVSGDNLMGVGRVSTIDLNGLETVYDPINVSETNQYWSNGFISHNCSFLYIDEVAFIGSGRTSKSEGGGAWNDFYTSVYPTLSSGKETKMLFTSTPNSLNHFYEFWEGAVKGTNNFNPIKATWEKVPGRDDAWKQATLESMNFDMDKFAQEFEGEFIGSSGTLINGATLKRLSPAKPLSSKDGLSIYTEKAPKRVYTMNCDVSHGKGLDYSAFSVIDVTELPYRQVAAYRNNTITPKDYAEIINNIARYYNDAFVLVENNDIGSQVTYILWNEFEYSNLLSSQGAGRLGKKLVVGVGSKTDYGIRMTSSVKKLGCSILKLLVEQNQLELIDKDLIGELTRFSRKNDSYAAEDGCTDDMVMGVVNFAWMTTTECFKEISGQDVIGGMTDFDGEELMNKLLGMGVVINGTEPEQQYEKFDGDDDLWVKSDYPMINW